VGKYPWDEKAKCYVGSGCEECGYTGKRRDSWFSPATLLQNADVDARRDEARNQTGG